MVTTRKGRLCLRTVFYSCPNKIMSGTDPGESLWPSGPAVSQRMGMQIRREHLHMY